MAYKKTNPNGQATMANSEPVVIASDQQLNVNAVPAVVDRVSFAKAITNNVDTDWGSIIGSTGSGMTVNQTAGNLLITSGTTARSETIIRSTNSYTDGLRMRAKVTLSQRIANQNFYVELVDVIGDALTYTINSATSITVTIPSTTFTAANVGQYMWIGGFSGTGTFLSGRYPIASVSGNDITYTVAGFAAGTGTCSIFGWNYYQLNYSSTVATNVFYDTQRKGYATGATTATINTTASPGHIAIITGNDMVSTFADQLATSGGTIQQTVRANRSENVPDDATLRLQIRVLNNSTAPATTTTMTVGFTAVSTYKNQNVVIQDVRPMGVTNAMPVEILRTVSTAITGTATVTPAVGTAATMWASGGYGGFMSIDVASAAITTTTTTAAAVPGVVNNIATYSNSFNIIVTVVSGTAPTMDVGVEESMDNGTNWKRIYEFQRITATGAYTSPLIRSQYGTRFRYVQTIAGTTPSFTRAINRVMFTSGAPVIRQFVDRTIVPTTINSTTPITGSYLSGYDVDSCHEFQLVVNMGAITTTAPEFVIDGSEDGTNWYLLSPEPLVAVASSTVHQSFSGVYPKFARARVSTAGVGATLGYVALKAQSR